MAKLLQLNPTIELNTPKGHGVCHFLIYDGVDSVARWLVLQEDGQWWEWQNHEVRGVRNFSQGRPNPEKPPLDPTFERFKLKSNSQPSSSGTGS
ncbi:MAG TPA: hypothetical protein VNM37_08105 [Candidatus Dormibacteraeota bacterium]|nr:hypothetical protein [Candidatus Dormibacteraeota bacterium]